MAVYRPIFRKQWDDPTTVWDWDNCTMAAGAMALDFDTLGHIQVMPGTLRAVSPHKGGGGDNLPDLAAAWAHYGQVLHVQAGLHWDDFLTDIKQVRGVVLQGLYGALPKTYHSPHNSLNFGGAHAMYVNPEVNAAGSLLVGDPLEDDWKWIPQAALLAYARALGSSQLGASSPQRLFFATTDPHVPAVQPSDPMPYVHTVQVTATPNLNVRAQPTTNSAIVGSLKTGATVSTTQLRVRGGAYTVSGVVRTDWLASSGGWIARAYTKLIS
jgi:hypothetical protein